MDQLNALLTDLAKELDLPELYLDDTGHCAVLFDDTVMVQMETDPGSGWMTLYAVACQVPEAAREDQTGRFFKRMLSWSLEDSDPDATLGLDEENHSAILCLRRKIAALSGPDFVVLFENFLKKTRAIRDDLLACAQGLGRTKKTAGQDILFQDSYTWRTP